MPSTRLEYEYGLPSDSCSTVWRRARELGDRLTTPLGTTCLAVLAFVGGVGITAGTALPLGEIEQLRQQLEARATEVSEVRGQLAVHEIQLDRLRQVEQFSAEYRIPADLAASVYDIALAEGVRPELAFRLVETESGFRRMAVSPAGAVGYTQIKPTTAAWLDPTVTYEQLFDTETNLRLGFRYFSFLRGHYEGDERLALLAYNRGPTRVGALLAMGRDPSNGYADKVLKTRD